WMVLAMTPRRPIGGPGRKPSLKPRRARGARPARIHNAVSGHDVAERVDRAVEANDGRGTRPESPSPEGSPVGKSSQPGHRDLAVGDVMIDLPQIQPLALAMPDRLADGAGRSQLA